MKYKCFVTNLFTVTFDYFNVSLLHKIKKNKEKTVVCSKFPTFLQQSSQTPLVYFHQSPLVSFLSLASCIYYSASNFPAVIFLCLTHASFLSISLTYLTSSLLHLFQFTAVPVTMETCQHVAFSSDEPRRWRQKSTHWWRLVCARACVPWRLHSRHLSHAGRVRNNDKDMWQVHTHKHSVQTRSKHDPSILSKENTVETESNFTMFDVFK